jgi:hypothetical protein
LRVIRDRYPLLKDINGRYAMPKDIAEYIDFIDTKKGV